MTETLHNIHIIDNCDANQIEAKETTAAFVIGILSFLSIILLKITNQTPSIWNWSVGILLIFYFPGKAILNRFEEQNETDVLLGLLRKVGLSIVLAIVVTFVLGLWQAIQLFNVFLAISSITLIVSFVDIWKHKSRLLIFFKNLRNRTQIAEFLSWNMISRSNWILVFIFLINLLFGTWLAVSNGIWRHGPFHGMIAQQIVKEGRLVAFSPFNVVEVTEQGRSYWPTAYPLAYHLLLAVMYMLGGELGILLLSPILSSLSILGVYVIVKQYFGSKIGLLAAGFFSIDSVTVFVLASVYMDSLILFFSILSIIEIKNLDASSGRFSIIFTGFWIGILASIKQTGILTALIVLIYGFVLGFLEFKANKGINKLKQLLKSIIIAVGIAGPFLLYQFMTFGSLLYPPFSLPFMNEIWIINPDSVAYLQRFQQDYTKPIYDILYEILLFPFPLTIGGIITSAVLGSLALLGLFHTINNEQKKFLIEFLVITSLTLVFIIQFRLVIPRYFLFLRIYSSIFVIQGIKQIQEIFWTVKDVKLNKISFKSGHMRNKMISFVLVFLISFSLLHLVSMDIALRNSSDNVDNRVIPNRIEAYQQAGNWIQNNTPRNVLILGGRAHEVGYYSQRDTFWVFWFGGHNIPRIFHARTAQEALNYLEDYKIDYIWLDRLQVANGFYESIPLHGLNDLIGFSPFFEKVYENNITRIFHVNYTPQNTNTFFEDTLYYGSILGGPFDFEKYQIIRLNDVYNWTQTPKGVGRNLGPNMTGLIEVQVDPYDFNLTMENISTTPASLAFYYHDTFEGNITINILDSNGNYLKLLDIAGKKSNIVKKVIVYHKSMFISDIWKRVHYNEEIDSGSIIYQVVNNAQSNFPLLGVLLVPGEIDHNSIPDIPLKIGPLSINACTTMPVYQLSSKIKE